MMINLNLANGRKTFGEAKPCERSKTFATVGSKLYLHRSEGKKEK